LTTTIRDLISKELEPIEASNSVQVAAKKMRDKRISSLLVMDSSYKPIGIITERDLVRKVCANDSSSKNTMVIDIMSTGLVTTDGISEVGDAVDTMMQNKVRHLLVLEGGEITKPLGIITPTDFVGYLRENLDIDDVNAKILESIKEQETTSEKYE
jgi:signal-transduction protein with cAMP-binding, CBS, and nucleotidyltransferase domain